MYSHRTDDPHNIVGHPRFPRSSTYDPDWVFDGHMVENPLWLLERLCEILEIPSGARVLDLACGKALTSVFLAEQYDARVVACDLWVEPGENWKRIVEAGPQWQIMPLRAEAHALPFAEGYYDTAEWESRKVRYFGWDEQGDYGQAILDDDNRNLTFLRIAGRKLGQEPAEGRP